MSYLLKNMTHSDKIYFSINIHNESWLLRFSKELTNNIIKSEKNALWDIDAKSQIWKTSAENEKYY